MSIMMLNAMCILYVCAVRRRTCADCSAMGVGHCVPECRGVHECECFDIDGLINAGAAP